MVEVHSTLHDAEDVFRRVPDKDDFFVGTERTRPSPRAFQPHPVRDVDGISVTRSGFGRSLAEIANRGPGKSTYLARLGVGDIRSVNLSVTIAPQPENPGHCLIPELNAATSRNEAMEMQLLLLSKVLALLGPFDSPLANVRGSGRNPEL